MSRFLRMSLMLVIAVFAMQELGLAETGEGIMPYEGWLKIFRESVTGPVAAALIIIGIVGAGAMLVWGGEIGTFLKSMIYLTLVACLIVGAAKLYTDYFKGDGFSLRDIAAQEYMLPEGGK